MQKDHQLSDADVQAAYETCKLSAYCTNEYITQLTKSGFPTAIVQLIDAITQELVTQEAVPDNQIALKIATQIAIEMMQGLGGQK